MKCTHPNARRRFLGKVPEVPERQRLQGVRKTGREDSRQLHRLPHAGSGIEPDYFECERKGNQGADAESLDQSVFGAGELDICGVGHGWKCVNKLLRDSASVG